MGKEELLKNLSYTKNILLENGKLKKEWKTIYYQKPQTISLKWSIIITIVFATSIDKSHPLVSLLCLLSPIWVYRYNKKMVSQKSSFMVIKKSEIDEQLQQNIEALKKSVIPPKYQDLWSLNEIKSYLVNQRADTLKECLNLLENDIKHNEQIKNLQVIQVQNEAIFQQGAGLETDKITKLSRN
jgi:hypothetical protein